MSLAEDVDRLPIPDPVNKPASGTYGEKAEMQRLEQSLPDPSQPESRADLPPIDTQGVRNVRSNRDAPGLPGVPAPIVAPTNRPGESINTPLDRTGGPVQQSPAQRRLAILDVLANSSEVSAETREWAQMLITLLTRS